MSPCLRNDKELLVCSSLNLDISLVRFHHGLHRCLSAGLNGDEMGLLQFFFQNHSLMQSRSMDYNNYSNSHRQMGEESIPLLVIFHLRQSQVVV